MKMKKKYYRTPIEAHNKERMQKIGDFIKEYRRDMFTRKGLAEEQGVAKSVIERAENGQNITVHSVFRICDALQLTPKELFTEIE